MTTLWHEIRYAARQLSRNLGFTTIITIVLALGIGANIAIFNVVDLVMLRDLPLKDPQQLVMLRWSSSKPLPKAVLKQAFGSDKNTVFSMSTYEFIEHHQQRLANLFAFADAAGGPARIVVKVKNQGVLTNGDVVTGTYFSGLEIQPAVGRLISPEDDRPNSAPVVVISYPFWSHQFGKDPSAIGQTIFIQGSPFTIVGVTPREFFGVQPGKTPDFWEPVAQWDGIKDTMQNMGAERNAPTTWWLTIMGRLKPNVSKEQIRSEMNVLYRQSLEAKLNSDYSPDVLPDLEIVAAGRGTSDMRQMFSHPLLTLMSIVALGLLIACGSVGVMVLARARSRSGETAVRLALGASRVRLVRQLLIESILVVGISVVLGGALAYWLSHTVMGLISGYVESLGFIVRPKAPDLSIFLFSAVLAALTGIICSLLPAHLAMHTDVVTALKESNDSAKSGRKRRWMSGGGFLVVLQVAVSLLVLSGAGLFIRTIENLERQDIGFNSNNLLVFDVNATVNGYHNAALAELYQRITERIQNLPGVVSATSSSASLISPWSISVPVTLNADGQHPDRTTVLPINMVGPSFFETMEIPVMQGRPLTSADQNSSQKVAVANKAFVDHFLSGEDPLGKRFTFGQVAIPTVSYELVGIAGNAKYMSVSETPSPMVYIPYSQFAGLLNQLPVGMHFEVRTHGSPGALVSSIRGAVNGIDPGLPIDGVKTQVEQIDSSLAQERLLALLSGILGLFVLLLAATSVYGVQAHFVTKRKYEIGIRMALGADRRQVLLMIWWQSLGIALIGVTIGLAGVIFFTRLIAGQLYGVQPTDPMTIACATTLLIIMVLIGGYLPAKKATDCDPARTLRQI